MKFRHHSSFSSLEILSIQTLPLFPCFLFVYAPVSIKKVFVYHRGRKSLNEAGPKRTDLEHTVIVLPHPPKCWDSRPRTSSHGSEKKPQL